MLASRYCIGRSLVCLCLTAISTKLLSAQAPTTWWPDPNTGLMWTGQASPPLTWERAKDYCASLQLGSYSGWRLPTPEEVTAIDQCRGASSHCNHVAPDHMIPYGTLWSSTMYKGKAFALCTRPMEADLLQISKDAKVDNPVSDVLTLKAYVPLTKARIAYQAGQYQESITQAEKAILIKPDFAPAYWAMGNSYVSMGQLDLAIANYEAALKIDKDYSDAKQELKWAKEDQKAAKDGKNPKGRIPLWE
jgi:tetratricopeptide (TPR) repeat protein